MSVHKYQARSKPKPNAQLEVAAARRAWNEGDFASCLRSYSSVLRQEPRVPAYHIALGNVLEELDRPSEAVAHYNLAIQFSPGNREAYVSIGRLYVNRLRRPDLALPFIIAAIEADPTNEESYQVLGEYLSLQGSLDGALVELGTLIKREALDPVRAYHGLQTALSDWGRYYEAKACNEVMLRCFQTPTRALANLGRIAFAWHDLEKAIEYLEDALSYDPNDRYSLTQYMYTWMQLGDYERARHERNKRSHRISVAQNKVRIWQGEPLKGKRVIVKTGSAGFGDGIQIARLVQLFKAEGAHVLVKTRPELVRLTRTMRGIDEVLCTSDEGPPADFLSEAHEIAFLRNIDFRNLGAFVPYIEPPSDLCEKWKVQIGSGATLKVGIAWRGADMFPKDRYRQRSMPFVSLKPLLQLEGLDFYSLQKGRGSEELSEHSPFAIKMLGTRSEDFLDTAAALSHLDLVITVDTSVAHLAGAMGKRTWVLVPFSPIDWRWEIRRSDDLWYPTVRLFRQREPGDWATVVDDVVDAIRGEMTRPAMS